MREVTRLTKRFTASRPEIMFSVCMRARFQAAPRECHLTAVKRILRYLKYSPNIGLWYPKGAHFDLVGFSDSDYAGCKVDRKSTSGGCQFLKISCILVIKEAKFRGSFNRRSGIYLGQKLLCTIIIDEANSSRLWCEIWWNSLVVW